jgi:peptide/nickel transport system ATP-binding protein/oligopeptide transport system ATP-binding protein
MMRSEAHNVVASHGRPGVEILRTEGLTVDYFVQSAVLRRPMGRIRAVDEVDLFINAGETLGLVGESGCGKSSVGRAILGLVNGVGGRVLFDGKELNSLSRRERLPLRPGMQIVLQDPFGSLNPRMTVESIVAEPLRVHGAYTRTDVRTRVRELLELVGLRSEHARRYPHEFSGGQRQRISIARSLALEPRLLILDEPVSALDTSVQAQIINLLGRLQRELSLSYLFISHDLAVVRHVCSRIAVMYLGKIVEQGTNSEIFESAIHPYTQALLASVPAPDPRKRSEGVGVALRGEVPSPQHPPSGCSFRTRCPKADSRCEAHEPVLSDRLGYGHDSACHYPSLVEHR